MYDILNSGSRNRFTILTEAGPLVVHNCVLGLGYGMGAEKFRRTLEIGQGGINVVIDINEAERIVRLYRQKNWKIVQFWQKCGNALKDMLYGGSNELHPKVKYGPKGIRLPNGFYIQYPALRETANGFMYISDARTYQKALKDRVLTGAPADDIAWTRVYGGKVTENCIAAGTEVLTNRGWVPIENVQSADMVHDGVEFVRHGGTVFKSVQPCIELDGVWMTPDHEVLTNAGWKEASQVQRPYRPNLRDVAGAEPGAQRWEESDKGGQTWRVTEPRPVFDILNAGPRQRFVVRGDNGPFIVHNCVQALAAIVIREQMVEAGKYFKVAFQVHDEIIICVPEVEAEAAQAKLEEIMSTPPKWAPDLPVACESGVANNYGDT